MKSRFAPSPTGYITLGNARTALFACLAAQQACFLLRIEDTDVERSKSEYVDGLKEDLSWLGLHWQEGPDVGGSHGPYFQSQRSDIYEHYYKTLVDKGLAYPCFCSEEQLELARKIQRAQGQAPRYAGTCRHLTVEELAQKQAQGLKPALRFRMPANNTVQFHDLVRGDQHFESNDIGDFIIRRTDGGSAFMFCNAIDDALMEVTLAMRGEDHLTNTPRQIVILQALGLPIPRYAHISLIMGSDGTPLSKRNGSRSIRELRQLGYLSIAVVNYLARLGHTYANPEFMTFQELAEQFDCSNLGKSSAKYDEKQLEYWQKVAVMRLSKAELKVWLADTLKTVPLEMQDLFLEIIHPNILFPADSKEWADVLFGDINLTDEAKILAIEAGRNFFDALLEIIESCGTDYAAITNQLKERLNVKGKALFQPLRVAVTGQLHGPELASMLPLIGKDRLLKRTQVFKDFFRDKNL